MADGYKYQERNESHVHEAEDRDGAQSQDTQTIEEKGTQRERMGGSKEIFSLPSPLK